MALRCSYLWHLKLNHCGECDKEDRNELGWIGAMMCVDEMHSSEPMIALPKRLDDIAYSTVMCIELHLAWHVEEHVVVM